MAIGSEPEVGATFAMWKDMSESDRLAWFKYMRDNWNPLMKGYATLVHNKNNPYYNKEQKMTNEPENTQEEKTETFAEQVEKSVTFIVDMMNSGKANPADVYPPNRYHGD